MRTLAAGFRTTLESSSSSEVVLIFVTITHRSLEGPIYINSDIMDYVYNGNTFLGAALTISLLTDDIQPPRAKISIPNVSRKIGEAILGISDPPQIKMEVFAKSDFTNANPRVAVGTPTVEYSAPLLLLRNVTCDPISITADITSYDLSTEPWPSIRSTQERLPGLFR